VTHFLQRNESTHRTRRYDTTAATAGVTHSDQMSLDRLLGTWDFSMRHSAMAEPVTGRQHYERVLDGAYVLLTWTYDHPDLPDAMALLSSESMCYFDVRDITRVFRPTDRRGWVVQCPLDPEFSQRNTARFGGADAMDREGEYSSDRGATWQHHFTMRSIRVA
jgi:hypothetical protein